MPSHYTTINDTDVEVQYDYYPVTHDRTDEPVIEIDSVIDILGEVTLDLTWQQEDQIMNELWAEYRRKTKV